MIKVKLANYDTSLSQTTGLEFHRAIEVEGGRVKELRMPRLLFERLVEQEWFTTSMDPVIRVTDLNQGLLGVLYGMNVTLFSELGHPSTFDLPDDTILVFYDDGVLNHSDSRF